MDKAVKKAIKATIGNMLGLLIGIGGSLAISLDKSFPYWLRYCGMTVFATILLFVTIVFGIMLFLAAYTHYDRTDPQSNEGEEQGREGSYPNYAYED